MSEDWTERRLQIVTRRDRAQVPIENFIEQGSQGALFPFPRKKVFIFVYFPDVTEREFRDLLDNAMPSYVIELRSTPRFDIGQLNRNLAFQAFQQKDITYADLTSSLMGKRDQAGAISSLSEFLQRTKPAFNRPTVFLLNRVESDAEFVGKVLEAITAFGISPAQVFEIPHFTHSALAR